jgi:dihydroorotase
VRDAKDRGVPVTAEVAPHHLLLTDEQVTGPDQKMNPPVREESDRRALVAALLDGTVDAIATDHAPHAPELKARGIEEAPFGVIGMESAFPAVYEDLVREGPLSLSDLVRLLTDRPARILGIEGGRWEEGKPADVNLLDLESSFVFDGSCLRSKSRNCPFLGRRFRGRVAATVAAGRWVVHVPERFRSSGM